MSPNKVSADDWLDVCRQWHALGGRGSATMMFGHVETLAERIEHLDRLRRAPRRDGRIHRLYRLDVSAGQYRSGRRREARRRSSYLKTLAVSRLFLDNFANFQASWVTQGLRIGQIALRFGANDLGSLMIEENVVAAAGTRFEATQRQLRLAIAQAGYEPRRRNVFYEIVES